MLFALLLNREATWVPGGNENIYFLYLYKAFHPGFLAGDWTIQGEPTAGHAIFNYLLGWPTLFMSMEIYGWIGRIAVWFSTFIVLMRLGRKFQIPNWMAFGGILLWLIQRQSFVATEWIIGTFEAKSIAYLCLLWAIDLILDGRVLIPALLTGLAFTFHTAVGLWGGAAIGLAFALQNPIRSTWKFAALAAIAALPGVISSLDLILGGQSISQAEAWFLVTIEMPFHLDPFTFGWGKIAVLYLMLLFNVLHARANPQNENLKFLARFASFTAAFFFLGILLRFAGKFTLVELFPFRVFAVMIMLLFFWHLAAAYRHRRKNPPSRPLIACGILVILALPSPIERLRTLAAYNWPRWNIRTDDFRAAALWVQNHAPSQAVVIAPPWRKDAFYFTHRPLIADWHAPRYNAMTAWRQRIEALVGDVSQMTAADNLAGDMDQRARDFYQNLTPADLSAIREKYGGDFLITTGHYSYPQRFQCGAYAVYQLSMDSPADNPGPSVAR